ncbi:hypothetical protein [Paenibacillus illinoisensis]|uniref:Putative ABC transporter-binding protein n=1 Tax=Paenibacillus illinoisensis TaxID=59845 RepID=A0A2W0CA91_9BACL|nr:hypothetical protein [Paenibacillus illinoisensis]PYY29456.1 putative ABC transporter-binding protein [Paenibacillus illinoisensis]
MPSIHVFGHHYDSVCLQQWCRGGNYQRFDRNNLPAVKNNQAYELQEDRYWYFDPITIQGQAEDRGLR